MRAAAALIDTVTALGALPGAVLRTALPLAPLPVRRALRESRRAGVAARRLAWYSALATLVLLAPPARAESGAPPLEHTDGPADASAAMLMVLAVLGAQLARRDRRGTFAG